MSSDSGEIYPFLCFHLFWMTLKIRFRCIVTTDYYGKKFEWAPHLTFIIGFRIRTCDYFSNNLFSDLKPLTWMYYLNTVIFMQTTETTNKTTQFNPHQTYTYHWNHPGFKIDQTTHTAAQQRIIQKEHWNVCPSKVSWADRRCS